MTKNIRLDPGQIEVVDDAMAEVLWHKTPAETIQIGCAMDVGPRYVDCSSKENSY